MVSIQVELKTSSFFLKKYKKGYIMSTIFIINIQKAHDMVKYMLERVHL